MSENNWNEGGWNQDMTPGMRRLQNRKDYRQMEDGGCRMDNFYRPPQEDFNTEEMRGSMQYILSMNIGNYVVCEFLIGTQEMVRKQGMLYFVGRSYVTLYDEAVNNFIVCDIFSVKFVYFYMPGDRPGTNFNLFPGSNGQMNNRRTR